MARLSRLRIREKSPTALCVVATVARAAACGEAVAKMVELAAWSLLAGGEAERAGVWLERGEQARTLEGSVVRADSAAVPDAWRELDVSSPYLAMVLGKKELVFADLRKEPEARKLEPLAGMQSAVWIPVRVGEHALGLAVAAYGVGRPPEDLAALRAVADALALGVAQQRAEQSRQRAEAELASVLDSVDSGILLLDASGRIRFANARLTQLLGLEARRLAELGDFDSLVEAVQECFRGSEEFARRWRELYRRGNEAAWDELELVRPKRKMLARFARPVFNAEGRRIGWLEMYRDYGDERLMHSRLLQTEKLAALGQLVSGVAHELNNPLTSIAGYAQLLRSRQSDADRIADAQKIYEEAERAGRIVKNLLLFARETTPERKPVNVNEIVERTLALRSYELKVDNIAVAVELDRDLPTTVADAHQLQQVVLNLLVNAEQAIAQARGHGHIWIRTYRLGSERLALEVADDGPGLPAEIASRAFDPFFTTKPPGSGTGLGLSIVYGIVREHGGEIYVDSAPGRGATFVVELPIVAASSEAPAVEGPEEAVVTPPKPGRRILVVEDEPTVAQLVADVLREEGHQVDTVLDSQEGLERASRHAYDLVICDVKMPRLDGRAFYHALLRAGSPAQHRIVFITGDTLGRRTLEFLEKTGLPYLAKPFFVEELKLVVDRFLASKPDEPQLARAGPPGRAARSSGCASGATRKR